MPSCPATTTLSLHDALPICCTALTSEQETRDHHDRQRQRGDPNHAKRAVRRPGRWNGWSRVGPAAKGFQRIVKLGGMLVAIARRSEEHTSELQSLRHLVCRLVPPLPLFPYTTLFRSAALLSRRSRRPAIITTASDSAAIPTMRNERFVALAVGMDGAEWVPLPRASSAS